MLPDSEKEDKDQKQVFKISLEIVQLDLFRLSTQHRIVAMKISQKKDFP